MLATTQQTQTQKTTQQKDYRAPYIFVVMLHSGEVVVGASSNPAKRICSINSGYNKAVPKPLQINKIIGVKSQNESRTFAGVVAKMCSRYGKDNVIAI